MKRSIIWKDVDTGTRDPGMPPEKGLFTMTVEPRSGGLGNDKQSFAHPFNLGTDWLLAKKHAVRLFRVLEGSDKRCEHGIETIALWQRGRTVAFYDGRRWEEVGGVRMQWRDMPIADTKPKQALRGSKAQAQMMLLIGTLRHAPFAVQFATIRAAVENDRELLGTKAFADWAKANLETLHVIAKLNGQRAATATAFANDVKKYAATQK